MSSQFLLSRLCISSLLWRDRPIDDVAMSMMRLGLVHLELSSAPLAPLHYQPGESNSRLFNMLAEVGVRVAALRLTGLTYTQKLHAIAEAGDRGIPAVLDRVERLGYPDLIDRVRLYSQVAAAAGVELILENDYYTSCDSVEAQLSLAHSVRQPALGFGFAPFHAMADNRDPGDEVRALGSALRLAYLWDAPESMTTGIRREDCEPGPPEDQAPGSDRGRVDWLDYFEALASVRFRGIFNLKWLGAEGWTTEQTEEAIVRSVRFCSTMSIDAGLGRLVKGKS